MSQLTDAVRGLLLASGLYGDHLLQAIEELERPVIREPKRVPLGFLDCSWRWTLAVPQEPCEMQVAIRQSSRCVCGSSRVVKQEHIFAGGL